MALSLSFTVQDLIQEALYAAGIVPPGGNPTVTQLNRGLNNLNLMMSNFIGYGIDTWARSTHTITCVNGQASYSIGPSGDVNVSRPITVINAYRRNVTTGIDVPMTEYSKQEYFNIPNKTQSGIPTQFYFDQEFPKGNLYVWPVPSTTDLPLSIYIDVHSPFTVASLSDDPDLPDEWQEAVVRNLAVRLAMEFQKPVTPEMAALARETLDVAKGLDFEEASLKIRPDYRSRMF